MQKKLISVIAIITMIFSVTTVSHAASSDTFIKMGLAYGTTAPSTATLSSDSGLALGTAGSSGITKSSNALDSYTTVKLIKNSDNTVTIADASGIEVTTVSGDGTACITSAAYFSANDYISYNGTGYRGGIIPYINSTGNMNIINYVNVEDYVKGVLQSEIGQSSAMEALKAQAVTARSFAVANQNSHKSQGFDVCSTTHCQVCAGVSGEYERTNQAVDATVGQMLYYNGAVVAGYYYANSGGHTENSEDVWSNALGYLRGKPDVYSPEYTWTVNMTKAQLDNAVAARNLGKIQSVSIDSVNESGYVASLTLHGTDNSLTVTKDTIRSVFGSSYSLKSRMFTLGTEGGTVSGTSTSAPSASTESSYSAYNASGKVKLGSSLYAVSSSGVSNIALDGMHILDASGNMVTAEDNKTASSVTGSAGTTVYLNSDSDKLIISGRGYGHGVGMAQQGAQQMGDQGFSYIDILEYYYTDIEVR